jgi:transcriptional regulator with XRE-family HTH domain
MTQKLYDARRLITHLARVVGNKKILAQTLGVSASTISRWFSKNQIPSYGLILIGLSNHLGCKYHSLVDDIENVTINISYMEARARQQEYEANNPSPDEFKTSLFRDINEGKYNGNV